MQIGILSRRDTGLVLNLKKILEKRGYEVKIYSYDNLIIDNNLFENDFYILKSKKELFLYAAYFLEANHIPVFPEPILCHSHRNRILAHRLIRNAGLHSPEIFIGSLAMLQKQLKPNAFPLVKKPIMGSENEGIRIINSLQELSLHEPIIYLEQYIEGKHYNVHFIENDIEMFQKKKLAHGIIKRINLKDDVTDVVNRWRSFFNNQLIFGHLDLVRETQTNKLYIVDVGTFPQFSHWNTEDKPFEKLSEIIIKQIQKKTLNK